MIFSDIPNGFTCLHGIEVFGDIRDEDSMLIIIIILYDIIRLRLTFSFRLHYVLSSLEDRDDIRRKEIYLTHRK